MFNIRQNINILLPRNEGKIKSYDSCIDVRAWSHDDYKKYCYLKDWIKCDMPVCFTPICTISNFLRSMIYKRTGKVAAFCRPECRSKVILGSIYTSCHAIKECLKNDKEFEKFFEEDEFETSHWPCERCLDILKNIKLFWKIILERIYNISIPKTHDCKTDTISHIAKEWQDEIVHQTNLVKKMRPVLNHHFPVNMGGDDNDTNNNENLHYNNKDEIKRVDKEVETLRENVIKTSKVCKSTYIHVKKIDKSCGTINNIDDYKTNLYDLQQIIKSQYDELRRLKRENLQLKNKFKNHMEDKYFATNLKVDSSVLKPFEDYYDEESAIIKDVESEMIITLKKCENKDFRHVSLIQVLHKSNGLRSNDNKNEHCFCIDEQNPNDILTKVHDKFGAIIKREMCIAMENDGKSGTEIKSSFHRLNVCDSTSGSKFVSATEVS